MPSARPGSAPAQQQTFDGGLSGQGPDAEPSSCGISTASLRPLPQTITTQPVLVVARHRLEERAHVADELLDRAHAVKDTAAAGPSADSDPRGI